MIGPCNKNTTLLLKATNYNVINVYFAVASYFYGVYSVYVHYSLQTVSPLLTDNPLEVILSLISNFYII